MKFAPIYRYTKRVIFSSMWKNSQPLIQLEESKPSVQSVHLELSNLAVQGCRLNEVATLGHKRSRFKVLLPDRTILEDKGVSGGHVGACFVEFGVQTRQKTRLEVGHSGSSVEKKMNSNRRRVAWSCPFFFLFF